MNFWDKMEKKFGRYAIHNLSAYIIALYVAGYLLYFFAPAIAPLHWYSHRSGRLERVTLASSSP